VLSLLQANREHSLLMAPIGDVLECCHLVGTWSQVHLIATVPGVTWKQCSKETELGMATYLMVVPGDRM
jgi:hypothetical protein